MSGLFQRRRDERGVVALIVAVFAVGLLLSAALVIDFGAVRFDRQTNKLAADEAAAAGLQAADQGTGEVYDSIAVCTAVAFLKSNRPALSGLPSCTTNAAQTCTPGDTSTAASYHGTTTTGSTSWEVWVKSPYVVTDTTTGGGFGEESLSTLASDQGDSIQLGCDQIGVVIKQISKPGLGRLAGNDDLTTRIRSVGRVKVKTGDVPPALLLLERTKCGVLTVGSAGSPSRIAVAASGSTPATIHSDSDATDSGCGSGSNQQLLQGKQDNGVVAYGTGTDPGTITTVASANGVAANIVVDAVSRVYGTTSVYPTASGPATPITGRKLVGRRPVDKRYLAGVTTAVRGAYPEWTKDHSTAPGYTQRYGCPTNANMTAMATMTAAQSVYIDCPGNSGITLNGAIGAGTIYFHGFIKSGTLAMPNATKVYVDDTDNSGARINASAVTLGNGNSFCVRATLASCVASSPLVGRCSSSPTMNPAEKAQVLVRRGSFDSTGGGLLRFCNSTVVLEGGQLGSGTAASPGGCLPITVGIPPTTTPCVGASTSAGTSPIALSGITDWTAPNAYGDMDAAGITSVAAKQALWDGGEDLALWDETYGNGPTWKMAGGGNMHVGGVFMVPNADPFTVTGGGTQDLTQSQFITRSFAVDGGATLLMQVDPNNAIGLPSLTDFYLVR